MSDDVLQHVGVSKRDGALIGSGRYPLGWGKNAHQHEKTFLRRYYQLQERTIKDPVTGEERKLTESEIANEYGWSIKEFREKRAVAFDSYKLALGKDIVKYHDEDKMGWSEIAKKIYDDPKAESVIRAKYDSFMKERTQLMSNTADALKRSADKAKVIDISSGVESYLNVTETRLKNAVRMLEAEGYHTETLRVKQVGTDKFTEYSVLLAPGVTKKEAYELQKQDKIDFPFEHSENSGRTFLGYQLNPDGSIHGVDSSRVAVRYAEDGGTNKDGVIELRKGVEDLTLGSANYAQVRIAVDGTHYLKGMAMYSDDLPDGIDIRFNTNKSKDVPMLGPKDNTVLKTMAKNPDTGEIDTDNPFGATVKQFYYTGSDGKQHLSPIAKVASGDKVNEEGTWGKWSKTLATQFLVKQPLPLIKEQLDKTYDSYKERLAEVEGITNPIVKQSMLMDLAEEVDKRAVDLKAINLPRQATHVILPIEDMPEGQIYAPKYNDGEEVICIRYPHQGTFEIPKLIVNNQFKHAKDLLGNAEDAVGIHPRVAQQLSGADFDGDTVVVIPTAGRKFNADKAIKELVDFEPKLIYKVKPASEGGRDIKIDKEREMGIATNILNDITLGGAEPDDIIKATKYAQVVIDAEKHNLDWRKARKDFEIDEILKKYRRGESGAATIISRAKSPMNVPERREFNPNIDIDKETGEIHYRETGRYITEKVENPDGTFSYVKTDKRATQKSKKLAEMDPYTLVGDKTNPKEMIYADHSARMKALANEIRKEYLQVKMPKVNPSAKETYKEEVATLMGKLNLVIKNRPLERAAQRRANYIIQSKVDQNPAIKDDKSRMKKIRSQAMNEARYELRAGGREKRVYITDKEWEAIQANAISANRVSQIIRKADKDRVTQLALPKETTTITPAKEGLIKSMLTSNKDYTLAEIANRAGVSVSTVLDVKNG